jgi:hypothetical protein
LIKKTQIQRKRGLLYKQQICDFARKCVIPLSVERPILSGTVADKIWLMKILTFNLLMIYFQTNVLKGVTLNLSKSRKNLPIQIAC